MTALARDSDAVEFDLAGIGVTELNRTLHAAAAGTFTIRDPGGEHAVACGLNAPLKVTVDGHVGYYCAGMNRQAEVTVHGNAGTGLAENIMSGLVRVTGNASQSAGASGHGGLVVIGGNASARCGISLKGADIVVGGNIGHMSGFMAQKGRIVVLGDAGAGLGDSLYEAEIFVRGTVAGLGADCVETPVDEAHLKDLAALLAAAGMEADPRDFRRFGSARKLYNFHIDNAGAA